MANNYGEFGIDLIAKERRRQIEEEKFEKTHDLEHEDGDLSRAALCYLAAAIAGLEGKNGVAPSILQHWPWAVKWWKPKTIPVDNLKIAGALIAAELDRANEFWP